MPAACRMASKTPPFLLMSLETGLLEAPQSELDRIKASVGGQEGLLREWGSGVSTGTGPRSEALRATREIIGVILQKPPLL